MLLENFFRTFMFMQHVHSQSLAAATKKKSKKSMKTRLLSLERRETSKLIPKPKAKQCIAIMGNDPLPKHREATHPLITLVS